MKNIKTDALSIILYTRNNEGDIARFVTQINKELFYNRIPYEIIVIDDHSTDRTRDVIAHLANRFPIEITPSNGKKNSLHHAFEHTEYENIAIIDTNSMHSAPAVLQMLKTAITRKADIVIAYRRERRSRLKKRLLSVSNQIRIGKFVHGYDIDLLSGMILYRKIVIQTLVKKRNTTAFDLSVLLRARDCGFTIANQEILVSRKHTNVSVKNFLTRLLSSWMTINTYWISRPKLIPFRSDEVTHKGPGFYYKGRAFAHQSELPVERSAFFRFSRLQAAISLMALIDVVFGLVISWHTALVSLLSVLMSLYFTDLLFNLYLVCQSFRNSKEIKIEDEDLNALDDTKLPTYTVFCPLYKEGTVLPQFIEAMKQLDYPKDKLQIMLLLEKNDAETISLIESFSLPFYFETHILPESFPKTKPKALNYGLKRATGKLCVIYDAEDVPDPLQLKKALLTFQKSNKSTVCVQAKLNFYNPHQNILAKIFTAEYSLWFGLVLTGLQAIDCPIPLGGTSNHFKTSVLKSLHGWDSFNVTEDADLGMRLAKKGYETTIMDSVTLEEANTNIKNWFGQRTRWIKGYMQTYLVHTRSMDEFKNTKTQPHVIAFQFIIGGKVLSMCINPIMWALTIVYFTQRAQFGLFIESFFPPPLLYMGFFSFVFGNFMYMYYYMIGVAHNNQDEIAEVAFLIPVYWLLMSAASWVAVYRLATKPHHWSKTKHGLHLKTKGYTTHQLSGTIKPVIPQLAWNT